MHDYDRRKLEKQIKNYASDFADILMHSESFYSQMIGQKEFFSEQKQAIDSLKDIKKAAAKGQTGRNTQVSAAHNAIEPKKEALQARKAIEKKRQLLGIPMASQPVTAPPI